jgi:hypothetical protein
VLQQQYDMTNNFDHLILDDPLQLQQSYEVQFGKISIMIDSMTKCTLKSKVFNANQNDTV